MSMQYRPDIDGLRAIAISIVVFAHAGFSGFAGGYVGVDVFFVISGFLITQIILGAKDFSFVRFYERRARRLLPALIIMLLTTTIVAWLILLPREMEIFGQELAASALLIPNIFAWQNSGYFGPEALSMPLLHLWSLGVEEQFYLLFPICIILLKRFRSKRVLFWTVAIAAIISFGMAEFLTRRPSTAAFYLLPPRAWELATGSLLAIAGWQPASKTAASIGGLIGLASIGYAVVCYDAGTTFPGAAAIPPVVGAALLIWAGGSSENAVSKALTLRPLVALGLISYPLYLWHWPLLSLYSLYTDSTPGIISSLVLVGVATILAAASWRWIEQPFRSGQVVSHPSRRLAAAMLALVPFAIGGSVLTYAKGFPERVDARVLQVNVDGRRASELLPPCKSGVVASNPDLCGYAAMGKDRGTVILWGDSHAEHFAAAVASQITPLGYKVALLSSRSCPPLVGVQLDILAKGGPVGRNCMVSNAGAPARLARIRDLKLVIISARWTSFVPSFDSDGTRDRWLINPDGSRAGPASSRDILQAGLSASARSIAETGARLMVIDQSATFDRSPRNCVARALRDGRDLDRCDRPDAVGADVRRDIARIIDDQAAASKGIAFHPTRHLCARDQCRVTHDGRLLYFDAHHLSREGARFYAPYLSSAVRTALNEPEG